MSLPIRSVAVSQRVDRAGVRGEARDCLDGALVEWLAELGLTAFPVPNQLLGSGFLGDWLDTVSPACLVLSGGNDIGSAETRDSTEFALLDYALTHRVPVLGICRGMQIMAKFFGASLVQVAGHAGTPHPLVNAQEGAFPSQVNSFHRWKILSCPESFSVLAAAEDGTIEAIAHNEQRWEGWMFHPERERPFDPLLARRARNLLGPLEQG